MIQVDITKRLNSSLPNPERFLQRFKEWKKAESESFLFGKDGAYISPKVNGESYVLRHVHLVPLLFEMLNN
ncbi:hypothetical protein [Kingella negevensis]|uniref:hypothetical protein n=1 Tax=Kingella negevensis TaxID=1522312 RepID=UPI00050A0986|nr:hypothetical protein [Kingella negevensis]